METTKKLELICNYVSKPGLPPVISHSYIETVTEDAQRRKRIRREQRINELLDEEHESYLESGTDGLLDTDLFEITTIKPVVRNVSLNGKRYLSIEDVYADAVAGITILMSTKAPLAKLKLKSDDTNFPPGLTHADKQDAIRRKLITRIIMSTNKIASEGRIGPATGMLVSPKTAAFITMLDRNLQTGTRYAIPSMVIDYSIPDDTIIVCRGSANITSEGFSVITSENKQYTHKTTNWENQYEWFEIETD